MPRHGDPVLLADLVDRAPAPAGLDQQRLAQQLELERERLRREQAERELASLQQMRSTEAAIRSAVASALPAPPPAPESPKATPADPVPFWRSGGWILAALGLLIFLVLGLRLTAGRPRVADAAPTVIVTRDGYSRVIPSRVGTLTDRELSQNVYGRERSIFEARLPTGFH